LQLTSLHPTSFVFLVATLLIGCAACESETLSDSNPNQVSDLGTDHARQKVADLPHAQGKTFSTLDSYLAHLKTMGAQDRPYYEKVGPDKYQLITGRGGNRLPPQYFTRDMLLKKFGFER
jgi:hypothetical protein